MPPETVQIKSQVFRYNNGGLNIRQPVMDIADNEATEAINNVFFDNGTIRIRPPWKTYTAVPVPIIAANFLTGVSGASFPSNGQYIVATDSSKIYASIPPSGGWTDITGAIAWTRPTINQTNGNLIVNFVDMAGYLIGFDGVNKPWKFDGSKTLGLPNAATYLNDAPGVGYVVAPIGYGAIVFQNRVFWCGVSGSPSRLFYSELNDPTLYKATSFIDVPAQTDSDQIMGFGVLFGNLMVFKRNSIYVVQGTDPSNFVVSRLNSSVGAISSSCIVAVDNMIYFMSDRGLYAANMFNVIYMSPKIEPIYQATSSVSTNSSNTLTSYVGANCKFLGSLMVSISQGRGRISRNPSFNIRDTVISHDYFNMDANGYPAASKFILGSATAAGFASNLPGPYCMAEVQAPIFVYPTVLASFGDNFVYYLDRDAWLAGTGADDYSLSGTAPTYLINSPGGTTYKLLVTNGGALQTQVTTFTAAPQSIYLRSSNGLIWQILVTDFGAPQLTLSSNAFFNSVFLISANSSIYQLGASNIGAFTTTLVITGQLPIEMTYTTKSFDFGDPNALKFLRWFWSEGIQPASSTLTLLYSNNPSVSETSSTMVFTAGVRTALPAHIASRYHRLSFYSLGGESSNFGIYLTQFSLDVMMKGRRG